MPAGTVMSTLVELTKLTLVAAVAPMAAVAPDLKLVPVSVVVPPAVCVMLTTLDEITVGAGELGVGEGTGDGPLPWSPPRVSFPVTGPSPGPPPPPRHPE